MEYSTVQYSTVQYCTVGGRGGRGGRERTSDELQAAREQTDRRLLPQEVHGRRRTDGCHTPCDRPRVIMGNTSCCYGSDDRQREWEKWDDSGSGAGGPRRFDGFYPRALENGEAGGDYTDAPTPYRSQMSLPPDNPGDPAAWRRYNPQARRESFGLRGSLIGGRFRVEETM